MKIKLYLAGCIILLGMNLSHGKNIERFDSAQSPCKVKGSASRMQSQARLNYAEAMPDFIENRDMKLASMSEPQPDFIENKRTVENLFSDGHGAKTGLEKEPIAQEGRRWATRIFCSVNPAEYNPVHTETYRIEGDTVINQLTYKKIYCYKTPDLSDRQLFHYACRQDDEKVFIYFYYTQNEVLFFDFSLEKGDLFYEERRSYQVFSVHDTLLNDGVIRKCIHLKDTTIDDNIKIWVEGIGSVEKGIFWEPFDYVGCTGTLLCCHQNDVQIYRNPNYNNCYVDKVANERLESNPATFWRLSPQPASESVRAVCEATADGVWRTGRWRLVDAAGKALQSGVFTDGCFEISLSDRPVGLYFVEITAANGSTCRLKCLKATR